MGTLCNILGGCDAFDVEKRPQRLAFLLEAAGKRLSLVFAGRVLVEECAEADVPHPPLSPCWSLRAPMTDVAILFRTHRDKNKRALHEVCSMSQPTMKKYPAAFKEHAVKLAVESDQPIAQTARDLGVNENTLHTWIGQYHRTERQEKQVNDEHVYEELKRLRKENARLKEEREILKKAAMYFAPQLP